MTLTPERIAKLREIMTKRVATHPAWLTADTRICLNLIDLLAEKDAEIERLRVYAPSSQMEALLAKSSLGTDDAVVARESVSVDAGRAIVRLSEVMAERDVALDERDAALAKVAADRLDWEREVLTRFIKNPPSNDQALEWMPDFISALTGAMLTVRGVSCCDVPDCNRLVGHQVDGPLYAMICGEHFALLGYDTAALATGGDS